MDSRGQTLSATRFAALTGVSRERLRTWERRHGFPSPLRVGGGPRRYATEDVARVVAVRHAVAEGLPLPDAISRARAEDADAPPVADAALAAVVEDLATPVVVLSGPAPVRIAYANAAVRALPGAPAVGAEPSAAVPGFAGSVAEAALERLFSTDAAATEVHHPAWGGHARHSTRSSLFRLRIAPGSPPLVAMVGIEGDGERAARTALAAQRLEVDQLRRAEARHAGWLEALARLAAALAGEPDPGAAIAEALDVAAGQTGASDAALALHANGRLVVDGSRRGRLAAGAPVVAAHPALARALRDGEPSWLEAADAAAWSVRDDARALAVPVAAAGEPLGVLLLLLGADATLTAEDRRRLAVLAAVVGFAALRERVVGELRRAASGG